MEIGGEIFVIRKSATVGPLLFGAKSNKKQPLLEKPKNGIEIELKSLNI